VKLWPNERKERGHLVVALQKAITSSFDEGDWKELGHETGTIDWITGHGRLLRSLSWGDSDYGGHVFDAIEMLRKSNESSLEILLGKEKIRRCLRRDSPEVYSAYVDSGEPVPAFRPRALSPKEAILRALADAETLINSAGASSAVDRVHTALHGYLIHACEDAGVSPKPDAGIIELYKMLRENHPKLDDLGIRADDLNKILRAFGAVLDALNTLRNRGSLAHPTESLVGDDEAMLAINAARTVLHYLDAKLAG
jgi:hypothetical protein